MYRCSMRRILTEKLHCNGFLTSQCIAIPLFQNSNKDKEFSFNFRHRHENLETSDKRQGTPPPHPLAGPLYYVLLVVYDRLVCH